MPIHLATGWLDGSSMDQDTKTCWVLKLPQILSMLKTSRWSHLPLAGFNANWRGISERRNVPHHPAACSKACTSSHVEGWPYQRPAAALRPWKLHQPDFAWLANFPILWSCFGKFRTDALDVVYSGGVSVSILGWWVVPYHERRPHELNITPTLVNYFGGGVTRQNNIGKIISDFRQKFYTVKWAINCPKIILVAQIISGCVHTLKMINLDTVHWKKYLE